MLSKVENISCTFCGKDRKKVDKMIAGPVVDDIHIYICNECIDFSYDVIHDEADIVEISEQTIFTPSQIKKFLDGFIIGQDDAKVAIAVAIYNHYKRIQDDIKDDVELEKSNLMMIGPSGSGKTLIVKTIAKLFNIPYVIGDATTLTEAGYVGEDVENLVELLLEKADGDVEKAQRGIVFIDEVDKITRKTESATVNRDVSGEGVQQALLKLIEGTTLKVSQGKGELIEFDTQDVLFICSGAFIGLADVIKKNRSESSIGLGATIESDKDKHNLLYKVNPEDLIKYGLIPEFVGRIPITVVLDELNEEMLVKILKEPKNNLLVQFKKLFRIDGVDLEFDDKYVQSVAKQSLRRKTGARGLRAIIETTLKETQFDLPDLAKDGLSKVVVDPQGTTKYVYKTKKKVSNSEETR